MFHKRKDKGCEAKIMAVVGERVLIESVSKDYFQERYGIAA